MKNALRWTLIALLFTAGVATVAQAQWRWRDGQGQVHISDLPPPRDVQEKDILQKPSGAQYRPPAAAASAASASAAPNTSASAAPKVDSELEARRKRAQQEQDAKAKKEEEAVTAAKAENCKRAKEYMRSLNDGMRISRVNEKGEREFLSDADRATETERARSAIASNCGN